MVLLVYSHNFFSTNVEGTSYNDIVLEKGYNHEFVLSGERYDNWTIDLVVNEGMKIDLYIIRSDEYSNYFSDDPFNVTFVEENISSLKVTWMQPDNENYSLVIDNKNNSRSSDTLPEGRVSYDLEYVHSTNLRGLGLGNIFNNMVIREGEAIVNSFTYGWRKGTEYEIRIEVINNIPIDLYIVTKAEYEKYRNNQQFDPVLAIEGFLNYESIWKKPDDQDYIFIIDNRDNKRTNDTIPSGNVTCNIEYWNKTLQDEREFFNALGEVILVICSAGIVLVIIVVAFYLLKKKKSDTMVFQSPVGIPPRNYIQPPQRSSPWQYHQQPQYPPPPPPAPPPPPRKEEVI